MLRLYIHSALTLIGFPSPVFQGYEGSLIKLTSKQVSWQTFIWQYVCTVLVVKIDVKLKIDLHICV